jgi:hypothetical protein
MRFVPGKAFNKEEGRAFTRFLPARVRTPQALRALVLETGTTGASMAS